MRKSAEQGLDRGQVERGLAADAAVDMCEQGGRDLNEVAAALDDAARETDEVADHPAPQCDDMIAALDAFADQPFGQPRETRPAFRALDRKSTRLNSITNAHLVCRLLLEKKKSAKDTHNH